MFRGLTERLRRRRKIGAMPGPLLLLLVMFVIGPIGLFLAGAIWSGLFGFLLVDDTEPNADAQAPTS